MCECASSCGTGAFNSAHCPGCYCHGRLMGEIKGTGRAAASGAKWPLCLTVSCRELLVQGQSRLPGTPPEEREENKEETGSNHKSTSSDYLTPPGLQHIMKWVKIRPKQAIASTHQTIRDIKRCLLVHKGIKDSHETLLFHIIHIQPNIFNFRA